MASQYGVRPGWFTTHVFNRIVAGLTRTGISVYGSRARGAWTHERREADDARQSAHL